MDASIQFMVCTSLQCTLPETLDKGCLDLGCLLVELHEMGSAARCALTFLNFTPERLFTVHKLNSEKAASDESKA